MRGRGDTSDIRDDDATGLNDSHQECDCQVSMLRLFTQIHPLADARCPLVSYTTGTSL